MVFISTIISYRNKKRPFGLNFKSMYKFRMLLSKKYLRKKNLSMTCLRKLLYFFTNKNQFIKSNSSNKNDYIIKKQKKTAFIAVF